MRESRRIVGVMPGIDYVSLVLRPAMRSDPYAPGSPITRIVGIIRKLSADQPVENPATPDDTRAKVLTPERLN